MMKYRYFIIGIALFVLFIGCEKENANSQDSGSPSNVESVHSAQRSKGNPSIVIPENSYEFAPVVDGTQVMHDYVIRNRGDGDLEIKRVKTG